MNVEAFSTVGEDKTMAEQWQLDYKDGTAFESISFGAIIARQGRQVAQAIIDVIQAASVEHCKKLQFGGP